MSTGAGSLSERFAFEAPVAASDGAGGVVAGFAERFCASAGVTHLRGGEAVLAARLEGQHTQVIRVRSFASVRAVTSDWRVRNTRTGQFYAIRDVTPTTDRAFIDFLVQSGVAT